MPLQYVVLLAMPRPMLTVLMLKLLLVIVVVPPAVPLPAALTSVGGYLDLRGYGHPLPNWIISAGADSRSYWFSAVKQNGAWRIRAGCRDFSVAAALAHWGSGGQSDNPKCLALVEHLVAEIDVRDAVVAEAV